METVSPTGEILSAASPLSDRTSAAASTPGGAVLEKYVDHRASYQTKMSCLHRKL